MLFDLPSSLSILDDDTVGQGGPDKGCIFDGPWGGALGWASGEAVQSTVRVPDSIKGSMAASWPLLPRPLDSYRFIVLIDSSVRGPFVSPMLKRMIPWWYPFLSRLNGGQSGGGVDGGGVDSQGVDSGYSRGERGGVEDGSTALMGSTISCEAEEGGTYGGVPHVQSYAMAMNRDALQALREAGLLGCQPGKERQLESGSRSRIWWDIEASVAVLRAGHGIDCLMVRCKPWGYLQYTST